MWPSICWPSSPSPLPQHTVLVLAAVSDLPTRWAEPPLVPAPLKRAQPAAAAVGQFPISSATSEHHRPGAGRWILLLWKKAVLSRSGLSAVGEAVETAAPTASRRVHRAGVRQRESREEWGAIAIPMTPVRDERSVLDRGLIYGVLYFVLRN